MKRKTLKSLRRKYLWTETKGEGQPCEQGETSKQSGCLPASGKPASDKPASDKPAAAPSKRTWEESEVAMKPAYRKWARSLSPGERQALRAYVEWDSDELQQSLRSGVWKKDSRLTQVVRGVDEALSATQLPETVVVYRGSGKGAFGGDPRKMIGKVITELAFASTSFNPDVAESFVDDGGVFARVIVPAGTRAAFMPSAPIWDGAEEKIGARIGAELLLPRNTSFKVVAARPRSGGGFDVDLEVVSGE